ncbi:rRNA maturation RNase YbeY [Desulfocurvibacter africanus]|uniref:rRNA maturation RNase YbeY n=1 Tax=Desulfocurvibacter africanus TaxID=873 RepID=UPI000417D418|nr:rRNA maturation RNase YbeY [Desulfocurvibacter africanus]
MSVSLFTQAGLRLPPVFPLSRHEILELCDPLLDVLGLSGCSFDLHLVDDADIARRNAAFMGCVGPTNVLSFPAGSGDTKGTDVADVADVFEEGQDHWLGEIVLSVDTLEREAFLYGQQPREHLVRLLAHAVLHLAGHDHGEIMDALTEQAVEALGRS